MFIMPVQVCPVQCSPTFPAQNAFGRAQAALVMRSEEALRVLPLITVLLLESSHWGNRRGTGQVGRGEELWVLLLLSEKCACVELCKVNMACQVDSIRCG